MNRHIKNGIQFENYILSIFLNGGYSAQLTPASHDYGADIILNYKLYVIAVQCKYYSAPVGISAVQQIAAAQNYYHADATVVVTNSSFTQQAIQLADSNHVVLIDGSMIHALFSDSSGNIPLLIIYFLMFIFHCEIIQTYY